MSVSISKPIALITEYAEILGSYWAYGKKGNKAREKKQNLVEYNP